MSKHCSQAMVSSSTEASTVSSVEKKSRSFCSTHLPEQLFLQHYLKSLFTPWIGVLVVPGPEPGKCSSTEPSQCFSHTEHSRCQFSVLSQWIHHDLMAFRGHSIKLGLNELFHQFCSDIGLYHEYCEHFRPLSGWVSFLAPGSAAHPMP